jgi:hypothetical protein
MALLRGPGTDTLTAPPPVAGPASPPALRGPRSRWRDPRLAVGVALVAVSVLAGARLLGGADDTVGVWVTSGALAEGQRVGAADVVRRQVHFEDQAAADHYLSADEALPAGATLDRGVGPGELLPRAALRAGGVQPVTELPLSVGADAVPGSLRSGSVVDVWVTPRSAAGGAADPARRSTRAVLVLDDVPVVSAPRTGTSLGPTATRQVIVGVGADQAARLPASIATLAAGDAVLTVQR